MLKSKFVPGKTYVPVSGKVFDDEEIYNAVKAARDGWWTEGEFAKQFEKDFSKLLGIRYVSLVNSGSSANLAALASLTSSVFGERRLKPGDEFITSPVAFPTTVNPGLLYGIKPVFIDVDPDTLNINTHNLEQAISKKTRLIMVAHTLGKPFDLKKVVKIAKKYKLWLIEDCCDALGSKYNNRFVSTFGDIATFSFYPAHQITMGEGGAVITNNPLIHRSIRQFRDWGRDCWCDTGKDDTCGRRFGWRLGDLPMGYDHKYSYSQIGYNLKLTDFQAAIGVAQLKKLPGFIEKRKENYRKYYQFFSKYSIKYTNIPKGMNFELSSTSRAPKNIWTKSQLHIASALDETKNLFPTDVKKREYFLLMNSTKKENPCWFGFPVVVSPHAPFTRNELTEYLEMNKIGTRNVFSGNLLAHPAYKNIKYRVVGKMSNADLVMNNAFWLGVYPGIGDEQIGYVKMVILRFLNKYS